MEKNNIIIIALIAIIAVLAVCLGYALLLTHNNNAEPILNNTQVNNTTVENTTTEQTSTSDGDSDGGQYGTCAVCGRALTYSEANSEYTQGKVCSDCAHNPYYQTGEGARYANGKLAEAYPDDYNPSDDGGNNPQGSTDDNNDDFNGDDGR